MLNKVRFSALWLAVKQSELFMADNIAYTNCLVTGLIPRSIMVWCYNWLVSTSHLVAIESLPLDEKENIWATAKEIAAGRLKESNVIELCKALYCLEYILNLKEWNGMPIN